MRNLLLLIDPQNDFVSVDGSLYVDGAQSDMENLIVLIAEKGHMLDRIIVTMDTHHPIHIASPCYWKNSHGEHPEPSTIITKQDLLSGLWFPQYHKESALEYINLLEKAGKKHTIWPPHALYGSYGWAVYQPLYNAIYDWSLEYNKNFLVYCKGQNNENTEMFSVIKPEVSLNPEEDLNNMENFLNLIRGYDNIFVGGEAEDFCLKETVNDMIILMPDIAPKLTVLTDCMSRIIKENPDTDKFWDICERHGVQLKESIRIL